MPELPEVETIVRDLRPMILGKVFWKVKVWNKNTVNVTQEVFQEGVWKKRVTGVWRRGKYIIIELEPEAYIVVHLRMTGRLFEERNLEKEKFIRVEFTFSDATKLLFSDVRKFGKIWFYNKGELELAEGLVKLGVDPFVDRFEFEDFMSRFVGKRGFLKNLLLSQEIIAGIGNIYADEIAFRVGLHPKSRVEVLNVEKFRQIYEAVIYCLSEGIKYNGATIADFRGTRGDAGKFQLYLQVYGRFGDPCYRCRQAIVKIRAAGRGTFLCLNCQKLVV